MNSHTPVLGPVGSTPDAHLTALRGSSSPRRQKQMVYEIPAANR
jgi:hypothetical protein